MSLIDTIISKALEFEGVSESPPGSNNVIFNTDYYGEEVEGEAYPRREVRDPIPVAELSSAR